MEDVTYYATGCELEDVSTETITQYIEALAENCTTYKERECSGIRFTMSEADSEKGKHGYIKQYLFDYGKEGVMFLEVYQDDNKEQHLALEGMVKGFEGAENFVNNINNHAKKHRWAPVSMEKKWDDSEIDKRFNKVDFDRFRRNRYCNFNNNHVYFDKKFFYLDNYNMKVKEKKISDLYKSGVVLPKNFEQEQTVTRYKNQRSGRWYNNEASIRAVAGIGIALGSIAGTIYGAYEGASYVYGLTNSVAMAGGAGFFAMGIGRKIGSALGGIALPTVAMTFSGITNTIKDAFSNEEEEIIQTVNSTKLKLNQNSLVYQCAHGLNKDNIALKIQDTNDYSVSKLTENNKEGFLISAKLDGEEKFGMKVLPKDKNFSLKADKNGNYLINKKDAKFVLTYKNGANEYSKTVEFPKEKSSGFDIGSVKTDIRARSARLAQYIEDIITHDLSCVPEEKRTYIPKVAKELSNEVTKSDELKQKQKRSLKPKDKVLSNSNELAM